MFAAQLIRRSAFAGKVRHFTRSTALRESKPPSNTQASAAETASSSTSSSSARPSIPTHMHHVTPLDRFVLVWVKRYPNKEAVPTTVSTEVMSQAMNRARIRTCNYMIAFTVICCVIIVWFGKRHTAEIKGNEDIDKVRAYYKAIKEENIAAKEATK